MSKELEIPRYRITKSWLECTVMIEEYNTQDITFHVYS